jgi:hypothetical protein
VLAVSRWLLPLWRRWSAGIRTVTVRDIDRLVEAMGAFQAGESRLLLAFRHPSLDDALSMAQLLWRDLPREGRRRGLHWQPRPHAHFLYDRGIPLWAGPAVVWLLRRLGGSSIQRGKLDVAGLRSARELLLHAPHPLAVAPEGATNGHNEVVSGLEPGVAQLAFWTAADLAAAGRCERMTILPIGLQYGFEEPVWRPIETLLSQLESDAGLPPPPDHDPDPNKLYERLFALAERTLTLMEAFYREGYRLPLPAAADTEWSEEAAPAQGTAEAPTPPQGTTAGSAPP